MSSGSVVCVGDIGWNATLFVERIPEPDDDQWEYGRSLCATADIGPNGTDKEQRRVRRLHDPMFRSQIARTRAGSIPGSTEMGATRAMHH